MTMSRFDRPGEVAAMSGAARRYRVIEIHGRACAIGAVDPQAQ